MLHFKVNAQYLMPQQPAHITYTESLHQHGQGGWFTRLHNQQLNTSLAMKRISWKDGGFS